MRRRRGLCAHAHALLGTQCHAYIYPRSKRETAVFSVPRRNRSPKCETIVLAPRSQSGLWCCHGGHLALHVVQTVCGFVYFPADILLLQTPDPSPLAHSSLTSNAGHAVSLVPLRLQTQNCFPLSRLPKLILISNLWLGCLHSTRHAIKVTPRKECREIGGSKDTIRKLS